jgi:hypothetical protein
MASLKHSSITPTRRVEEEEPFHTTTQLGYNCTTAVDQEITSIPGCSFKVYEVKECAAQYANVVLTCAFCTYARTCGWFIEEQEHCETNCAATTSRRGLKTTLSHRVTHFNFVICN